MKRPSPSFGGNSTKDKIIETISLNWPLSAKKIHNLLKKEHRLSITYQASYKAITELTRDKILKKEGKNYLINKEWASRLGEFVGKIKKDLDPTSYKKEIRSISKFTFKNYGEFIDFYVHFVENIISKEGKADIIFHYRHTPHPFILSESRLKKLKALMPKIKWTILSKSKGPLEEWNAKKWKKLGVRTKLGADISSNSLIIINDYIIEIYTPKESLKKWDNRTKNIENYEVIPSLDEKKRNKAWVTILKDKELSEILRAYN